ncbi:hypothetical protein N7493_012005 [Penicillium malachiteum]|uniref:VWFA domain-containing protein n=1 Tax=Penicillium malachiteum TaxID=1324776 RepID=A0AAD6HA32_9EURO|nr:hypothetical protein N7493_012005 [Penicillium malachiteum]
MGSPSSLPRSLQLKPAPKLNLAKIQGKVRICLAAKAHTAAHRQQATLEDLLQHCDLVDTRRNSSNNRHIRLIQDPHLLIRDRIKARILPRVLRIPDRVVLDLPPGPPGGQYGAPGGRPPPQAAPPTPQQVSAYRQLLIDTIQEKHIQSFYPPERLDRLVQSLANDAPVKLQRLIQEWNVPMEVATDVMKLSLFDVILYVDDSGSIEFEEKGLRKDQLRQILGIVATAAATFDQDGISVRFMNSQEVGDGIRSADDVNRLVSRVRFSGLTPLGTGLRNKVIDPMIVAPARAGRLDKPVLVITITDGQPAGEAHSSVHDAICHAVEETSRTRYGRGAVSFQFSQVGNDQRAREFLGDLDEDPQIGSLIDCTSNFEVEQDEMSRANPPVHLTRELWCAKLMLGAIDSSYDTKDEKAAGRAPGGGAPPAPYGGYNQPPPGGQQGLDTNKVPLHSSSSSSALRSNRNKVNRLTRAPSVNLHMDSPKAKDITLLLAEQVTRHHHVVIRENWDLTSRAT